MSAQAAVQTQTTTKPSITPVTGSVLQRQCACGQHANGGECAECGKKREGTLQRAAIRPSLVHDVPPIVHEVLRSPGQPLDAATRAFMEPRFRRDFSWISAHSRADGALQTKLAINKPGDEYEQEADRIANQVMAAPGPTPAGNAPSRIQRHTGQPTGQMDTAPASVDRALASSGRPLEPALRQDMEQRFGHDFSQVRVHTGAAAEQTARDVNANAYTLGYNVVFGPGQYSPRNDTGRRLLAHELAHVVQQTASPKAETKRAATATARGIALHQSPPIISRQIENPIKLYQGNSIKETGERTPWKPTIKVDPKEMEKNVIESFRKAYVKFLNIIALEAALNQSYAPKNLIRDQRLPSDHLGPYTPIDPSIRIKEKLAKESEGVKSFEYLMKWTGSQLPGDSSVDTFQIGLEIDGFKFDCGQTTGTTYHEFASGRIDALFWETFFIIPELRVSEALALVISLSKYASKLAPLTNALKYLDITLGREGFEIGAKYPMKYGKLTFSKEGFGLGAAYKNIETSTTISNSYADFGLRIGTIESKVSITDEGMNATFRKTLGPKNDK
jgi:hypothetical protein